MATLKKKIEVVKLLKKLNKADFPEAAILEEIIKELEAIKESIPEKVELLPYDKKIEDIKSEQLSFDETLKGLEAYLSKKVSDIESVVTTSKENISTYSSRVDKVIAGLQKEIELIRLRQQDTGGGSKPPTYYINSSVLSTRYADLNFTGSVTATDNNTTKRVDVSFTGGGGSQTPWTSNINGAGYDLGNVGHIGVGKTASSDRLIDILTQTSGASVGLRVENDDIGNTAFGTYITGDTNFRYDFSADGTMEWSDGTSLPDVQLYRSGAGLLSTPNTFIAGQIGVGVTPNSLLHIFGEAGSFGQLNIDSPSSSDQTNFALSKGGDRNWAVYVPGTDSTIRFYADPIVGGVGDVMTLTPDGTVGIGTTDPFINAALTVQSLDGIAAIRLRSGTTPDYRGDFVADTNGLGINSYDDSLAIYRKILLQGSPIVVQDPTSGFGTDLIIDAPAPNYSGFQFAQDAVNYWANYMDGTTLDWGVVEQGVGVRLLLQKSTGFMGVNTGSPAYTLDVNGDTKVVGAFIDSTGSPGTTGDVLTSTITGTAWGAGGSGGSNWVNSGSDAYLNANAAIGTSTIRSDAYLSFPAGSSSVAIMHLTSQTAYAGAAAGMFWYTNPEYQISNGTSIYNLGRVVTTTNVSTRVPFYDGNGAMTSSSALTFNSGSGTLSATTLVGAYGAAGLTGIVSQARGGTNNGGFTASSVIFQNAGNTQFSNDSAFTYTATVGLRIPKQYSGALVTTTTTLDWNSGNVQKITLANNGQTFTFANPVSGGRYILILKQPASGAAGTVTWPGTVLWPGAVAPTLTATNGQTDIISFIYDGGVTKYFGNSSLNF